MKDTNLARQEEEIKDTKNIQDTFPETTNEDEAYEEDNATVRYIDLSTLVKASRKKFVKTEILEMQIEKMFNNLSRVLLNSVILIGPMGSGKTTIVEYFTKMLNEGKCPPNFCGANVIKINANCFSYQACYDEIVYTLKVIINNQMIEKKTNKIILFFEDVEEFPETFLVLYKRIMEELSYEVEYLKGILEIKREYIEANQEYGNLSFVKDNVYFEITSAYKIEEVSSVLKPRITELCNIHNVTISKKMADYLILMYNSQYVVEKTNLTTTVHLIENALIIAKHSNKNTVDYETIEKVFSKDFSVYKSLSKKARYEIAYHEAGHTLLVLSCPKNLEFKSVKCIYDTNSNCGGLTMFEMDFKERFQSKKVTKELIAFYLAGREAERLLGKCNDSGAIGDLQKANATAKEYIYECGDFKKLGENCFYDIENDQYSDKTVILIEKECRKLIKKSTKLARKILKENKDFLDLLAKELFKKGILSKKEVYKLWNRYNSKKKK